MWRQIVPGRTGLALWLAVAFFSWSCGGGGRSPSPGSGTTPGTGNPGTGPTPPPGTTVVTGRERLTWNQPGDASGLVFRAYIDAAAVALDSATCAEPPDPDCSTPLPALTDGLHTISVTAISASGTESVSSEPITVQKVSTAGATSLMTSLPRAALHADLQSDVIVSAPDGRTFVVDTVAESLAPPLQLATVPDGRLLVAGGDGRVSILLPGGPERGALALDTNEVLDRAPGIGPVGVAVHPEFARNHFVYVSVVSSEAGGAQMRIVRLREAGGLLGEPATVFEAPLVTASGAVTADGHSQPVSALGARLAFGPDGLLYALLSPGVAFDREPAASAPFASIARIDSSGRVPDVGALEGVAATPLGLAWHPATNDVLTVFGAADGTTKIASIAGAGLIGAQSTAAIAAERRPDGIWSGGRLRFESAEAPAAALGRAFVERLDHQQPVVVRLAVPVVVDGLLGSLAGELMDVVAAAGVVYAAVTPGSAAVSTSDRQARVLRLRPQ